MPNFVIKDKKVKDAIKALGVASKDEPDKTIVCQGWTGSITLLTPLQDILPTLEFLTQHNHDNVLFCGDSAAICALICKVKKLKNYFDFKLGNTSYGVFKDTDLEAALSRFLNKKKAPKPQKQANAQKMQTDHKQAIIDNLTLLMQMERANKQHFKATAYANVIKQLKYPTQGPIMSIDDIDGLKGVGKSIKEKIEKIIEQGYTEQTQDALQNVSVMNELTDVMGIGAVKAKQLIEVHGISSIAELRNRQELLNDKQRLGLHYYEDFLKRIPRTEMEKHYEVISKTVNQVDTTMRFEIAGSYRRGKADSGDIDVLVTHTNDSDGERGFKELINKLKQIKYLVADFALGDKKYNGVCKLPRHKANRRIDIMYTSPERFPFALLYFTGSQEFNIAMRNHALQQGYSLNEYGLKVTGSKKEDTIDHKFYTEEDVFEFLKIKYVAPKKRERFTSFESTSV